MPVNPDFNDLLSAGVRADYRVIGAHAVMYHSEPRYPRDLDIWVRADRENATRVCDALSTFGARLADLTVDDLATEGTIFQIGVEPHRIDITTRVDGIRFEEAWDRRVESSYGDVSILIIGKPDLEENNARVVGRRTSWI